MSHPNGESPQARTTRLAFTLDASKKELDCYRILYGMLLATSVITSRKEPETANYLRDRGSEME
jgi:hypothetical protein